MEMISCDMHEELFVEMISPQEPVPLNKERVAEEWRYYKMSPENSSKYAAIVELMVLYDEACFYDRAITVCKEALSNSLLKDYKAGLYFRNWGRFVNIKKILMRHLSLIIIVWISVRLIRIFNIGSTITLHFVI